MQAVTAERPEAPDSDEPTPRRLPRHILVLGIISLLTAMSSAMVYGLLPVFLVRILGATVASVGVIEGVAEATTSLAKIVSGFASDRMGRRKPLVLFGYAVSAVNKVMFPLAGDVFTVLAARVIDRGGKGMRDAPRRFPDRCDARESPGGRIWPAARVLHHWFCHRAARRDRPDEVERR